MIVGEAKKGFFVLDTKQGEHAEPNFVATQAELPPEFRSIALQPCLQMSATRPSRERWPMYYEVMDGKLGLADDEWSLAVQILGFPIAILIGWFTPKGRSVMNSALVLGLVVNVIAMFYMAGGGQGAFLGFFGFPIMYWFPAWVVQSLRPRKLRTPASPIRADS
ncbi:MAG: hypothetical protein QM770_03510 [Tepidisphaeraceae bacterium]